MLRARESFHAGDRLVAADEPVHDHDEIVAGREHLFDTVDEGTAKPRRRSAASSGKSED